MRMRLKKHLDERIADCASVLLAREGDDFYKLTDEDKASMRIDIARAFDVDQQIVLEIGCGKGAWAIQSCSIWAATSGNGSATARAS